MIVERWRSWGDECPGCGDNTEVLTNSGKDYWAGEGDKVRCVSCEQTGVISADEDGVSIDWHEPTGTTGSEE